MTTLEARIVLWSILCWRVGIGLAAAHVCEYLNLHPFAFHGVKWLLLAHLCCRRWQHWISQFIWGFPLPTRKMTCCACKWTRMDWTKRYELLVGMFKIIIPVDDTLQHGSIKKPWKCWRSCATWQKILITSVQLSPADLIGSIFDSCGTQQRSISRSVCSTCGRLLFSFWSVWQQSRPHVEARRSLMRKWTDGKHLGSVSIQLRWPVGWKLLIPACVGLSYCDYEACRCSLKRAAGSQDKSMTPTDPFHLVYMVWMVNMNMVWI